MILTTLDRARAPLALSRCPDWLDLVYALIIWIFVMDFVCSLNGFVTISVDEM